MFLCFFPIVETEWQTLETITNYDEDDNDCIDNYDDYSMRTTTITIYHYDDDQYDKNDNDYKNEMEEEANDNDLNDQTTKLNQNLIVNNNKPKDQSDEFNKFMNYYRMFKSQESQESQESQGPQGPQDPQNP